MTFLTFTVIRFINSLSPGVSYTYHTVCGCDFANVEFKQNLWIDISSIEVNISRNRCQRISLMVGQHWLMYWLGTVRQLAITRTTVDQTCVAIWRPKNPVGWHEAAYSRVKIKKNLIIGQLHPIIYPIASLLGSVIYFPDHGLATIEPNVIENFKPYPPRSWCIGVYVLCQAQLPWHHNVQCSWLPNTQNTTRSWNVSWAR